MSQEEWERIAALANKPEKSLAVLMSEAAEIKAQLHALTTLLSLLLVRTGLSQAQIDQVRHIALEEGRKTHGQRAASRLTTLGALQTLEDSDSSQ